MVKAGVFFQSLPSTQDVLRASHTRRAYPPQDRNDFSVFEDFRNTVEADFDSTFRRVDRHIRSVEDAMLRLEREGGANSRQYKREWRSEGSSGREYFHESVVVSRPSLSTGTHRQGGLLFAGGYLGVAMATIAAVLYVQKAREFRDVADESVYRGEHLSRLSAMAPVLAVFSLKFRQEWARAAARKDRLRTDDTKDGAQSSESVTDV
jgi:hypothetical protein